MRDFEPEQIGTLESILQQASSVALDWCARRGDLAIDEKSIGQFATNVDLELEALIRKLLMQHFPGTSIIGEEFGGSLSKGQTGWAIDPIDGTTNFIMGLPIWGISIGYIQNGRSDAGAIALPELGIELSAAEGAGLRILNPDELKTSSAPPVKTISIGENDYEPGPATDERAQHYREKDYSVVRYRCAVFSLTMTALGRLSGYIEHGCGLWDIAAAEVICREAGLQVHSSEIAPGRYAIDAQW